MTLGQSASATPEHVAALHDFALGAQNPSQEAVASASVSNYISEQTETLVHVPLTTAQLILVS